MDKKKSAGGNREVIRAIKFGLFSISAGIIETITFSLLELLTDFPYWPCYLIALVLSVLWNFTLNRQYTFQSANNVPIAMLKIACFYAVFTPVTTIGGSFLADTLHWNDFVVLGLTMALNLTTEFLYDRYFVFRNSIDTNKRAQKQKEKTEN